MANLILPFESSTSISLPAGEKIEQSIVDPRYTKMERQAFLAKEFSNRLLFIEDALLRNVIPSEKVVNVLISICRDPDFSFTTPMPKSSASPLAAILPLSEVDPEIIAGRSHYTAKADSILIGNLLDEVFSTIAQRTELKEERLQEICDAHLDRFTRTAYQAENIASYTNDLVMTLLKIAHERGVDFSKPLYDLSKGKGEFLVQLLEEMDSIRIADWLIDRGASCGIQLDGNRASIEMSKLWIRLRLLQEPDGSWNYSPNSKVRLFSETETFFSSVLKRQEILVEHGDDAVSLVARNSCYLSTELSLSLLRIADSLSYPFETYRNFYGFNLLMISLDGLSVPPPEFAQFLVDRKVNPFDRGQTIPRPAFPSCAPENFETLALHSGMQLDVFEGKIEFQDVSAAAGVKEYLEVFSAPEDAHDRLMLERAQKIMRIFKEAKKAKC